MSANQVAHEYGLQTYELLMLIAAYEVHGSKIIYEPPQVTPEFRLRLTLWAIKHDASYVQVARKFGYTNVSSIWKWKKIYIQKGTDGLQSLKIGRKTMTKPKKQNQDAQAKRITELEEENLMLRIRLEASKLLASMEEDQTSDKLPKSPSNSRRNSNKSPF